jgi:hypothetical protein
MTSLKLVTLGLKNLSSQPCIYDTKVLCNLYLIKKAASPTRAKINMFKLKSVTQS